MKITLEQAAKVRSLNLVKGYMISTGDAINDASCSMSLLAMSGDERALGYLDGLKFCLNLVMMACGDVLEKELELTADMVDNKHMDDIEIETDAFVPKDMEAAENERKIINQNLIAAGFDDRIIKPVGTTTETKTEPQSK